MIGVFGKSLNYKGDSTQNFIFVHLFTSFLNFKWAQEFFLYIIVLHFNLEFFVKYQSRGIMDCYCMRFVLFEDLGNMNPKHEFMCVCVWIMIACDVDDDNEMRY